MSSDPSREGAPLSIPSTDQLRVLHVVAPARYGGLERVVANLSAGQRAAGHLTGVVAVLEAHTSEHPFVEELQARGTPFFPLRIRPRDYHAERREIARLIRSLRPDVVHTHGYRPDVVNGGIIRRMSVPVVTTVHGFTGGGWRNRAYEWIQKRCFRGFDAVVAVSRPLGDQLIQSGVDPQRLHVIPNAWQETAAPLLREAARAELNVPPDRLHVGWVGRLSREKGLDVLIDALAHLADLPLLVSVIGSGQERPALEKRATSLGVANRIAWRGVVTDASRLFAGFDAFVLSSRTEGTPMTLFEAMAACTPVVSTRVGGIPDVVSSTEAWIVPAENPLLLGAALRAVFASPRRASERARAARQRLATDFAPGPWLDRYQNVYQQIQSSPPTSAR